MQFKKKTPTSSQYREKKIRTQNTITSQSLLNSKVQNAPTRNNTTIIEKKINIACDSDRIDIYMKFKIKDAVRI